MKFSLPENTLLQLSDFIASHLALNFPKKRWNDLERNIVSASNEFGYKEVESFIQRIMSSPLTYEHIEILTAHLTNNETYFWREHKTFEVLEQNIFPELIQIRQEEKRIRIWSAGCSTGEEPYSIAIALSRSIPNIKDWNITILATDISPRILRKATAGVYSQWAFRNSPQWLKENYFLPMENNKFELIPMIKSMVKFEYLNLADDVFPSPINNTNAMDIIFCRNVLMYFTQDRFRQVSRGLYNSLVQGGYFVVSASELSTQNFPEFKPVNVPGMVIYQKTSTKIKDRNKITFIEQPPEPFPIQLPQKSNYPIEWTIPQSLKYENIIPDPEVIPKQIVPIYEEILKAYSKGDYAEVIDKLENDEQTLDEQILLIRAFANEGNLIEALKICEKTNTANKLDPRLYYLYATILQENNQLNEAVVSLKRAIYLDTNFVLSYYLLGNIYQRLGDVQSAKKSYEIVLSLLNKCSKDEILFESEGLTAGRFKEIINATMQTRELL